MLTIEEQLYKYYNWTSEYSKKVIFEYERFLYLRSQYNNILPPDIIDKLWMYHILNIDNYINYCLEKFKFIIIYEPLDRLNNDKNNKILNFYNIYKTIYNEIKYPEVWTINYNISIENLIKIINHYPEYKVNQNKNEIKVFVLYKDQTKNYPNNKQIFTLYPNNNDNIDGLLNFLSYNLNINKYSINIYPHPDIKINDNGYILVNNKINNFITLNTLLSKSIDFLIAEI